MATDRPVNRSALGFIFLLSAIGAGIAGYLAYLHYAFQRGDFIAAPACGGAGSLFDCHLVALSSHAILSGRPLAVWGAALYAIWFVLAVAGWSGEAHHRTAALRLIAITALLAVLADVYLAWVMLAKLHAVCLWCVATYALNATICVIAWWSLQRAGQLAGSFLTDLWLVLPMFPPTGSRTIPLMAFGWCLTILVSGWGMTEVTQQLTQGNPKELREQVRTYRGQQSPAPVVVANAPVRGASTAAVTIIEFSDFLCPACQRASTTIHAVIANHPAHAQFAFKHYPLDQVCNAYVTRTTHPGACQLATAASCAHAQGKFWPLHDRIFAQGPKYNLAQLEADAQRASLDMTQWRACLSDGSGVARVKDDIEEAHRLQVSSTPTFYINGYQFGGAIPPAAFELIVQEFLQPAVAPEH